MFVRRSWPVAVVAVLVACIVVRAQTPAPPPQPAPPRAPAQPLAFSHRQHVTDLYLECRDCHANPDAGTLMTYPASSVCLSCHRSMPATRASLQAVLTLAASDTPIAWKRVYQVPDFVYWQHGPHLAAKITCEQCHGPVGERDTIALETDVTTMTGCQRCHEQRQVLMDCGDCHEPRQ
jgi:hypothetical protein